jgi:hypothetical protein
MKPQFLSVSSLICAGLIFNSPASGSPLGVEDLPFRLNPHSHTLENEKSLPAFPYTDSQVERFAKVWATVLGSQFSAIRAEDSPSATPACDSIETFKKLRAAYVFGRYDEVLTYADGCGSQLNRYASRYAALAAIGLSKTKVAEGYLRQAIAGLKSFNNEDMGTLLLWASWRLDPSILDLNPGWTIQEKRFYFTVIQLSNRLGLQSGVSMTDYRKFVDNELASPGTSGFKRDLILSLEARRMFYEDDTAAFEFLNRLAPQIQDPTLWLRVAYRVLFASPSTPSKIFRHADTVYRATWPYLHARSPLPTEDNVYTYTEIYDRECKTSLTQGKARIEFFELKEKWRTGTLATADFRKSVQQLLILNPNKSDLLVALSTFSHMDGDLSGSRDLAWKAH